MAKSKKNSEETKIKPTISIDARESQLISLATDLAEKQLREGTASSQVITHYLKLGTTRERLEKEKLEEENKLLKAKTENLQSAKRTEELYAEAIKYMQIYSGNAPEDYYEEETEDIF